VQKLINDISSCLVKCDQTIQYLRQQNLYAGLGYLSKVTSRLMDIIQVLSENMENFMEVGYQLGEEEIVRMLHDMVSAQEQGDYILVSDLMELQVKPLLFQLQEILLSSTKGFRLTDEEVYAKNLEGFRLRDKKLVIQLENCTSKKEYVIEPTSSGHHTMLVKDALGQRYFHSNVNPITEAEIFARRYYSQRFSHYVVYGLGLGYHVQSMIQLDDGICIDIVESDLQVIKAACKAVDLEWLYNNPRVQLHFDPEHIKLGSLLDDKISLVIHYPSMKHIQNDTLRLQLEKYFISDSGKRNFAIQFANNFRDNLVNCDGYVDELEDLFCGKNAIIVAAGPSLDKNVELLKTKPDNTIVVAVGTVFRKLIEMGIVPDSVVVLDAQPHLYKQVEGLEKQDVPLLCGATACKKIAAQYQGKKYLVCQKGYPKAEEYANSHGYRTYETGGSVSTIALDICIQLGCKSIAFIGLDLAFTDGYSHAMATSGKHTVSKEEGNIRIKAIDGSQVAASHLFVMYREWIERRVRRLEGTPVVYDATEGGAYKDGLEVVTLSVLMKQWEQK